MHNIEYKAELRDLPLARGICRVLGAGFIGVLDQIDTYFRIPSGRLKRREAWTDGEQEPIEYIFYDRPNRARPRLSHFVIYTEKQAIERFGCEPLPVRVVVRKRRELYMRANVRIHLDEVEHLGRFLEFEALVAGDCTLTQCRGSVDELRAAFMPVLGEPIDCGYADLLEKEIESEQARLRTP